MKLSTLVIFALGLAIGGGAVYYLKKKEEPDTIAPSRPRTARSPQAASALGRIQPSGGILALGVPLPDQLAKLGVKNGKEIKEGDEVNEGDILAELVSAGDRMLELGLLDSQIKEAEQKSHEIDETGAKQLALEALQAKQIEEQGPLDISMQKLKVEFLKKQVEQAKEALARITSLTSVSRQEKDQQEMAALQSQSELAAAEDGLRKLESGHALNLRLAEAKMNLSKATLERTRHEVPLASLKQQREIAARRLELTYVKAPTKGTILRILARPGELVSAPQPILQMADLARMAVVAEVYETDVGKIFEGQKAVITSKVDSARKLTGTVSAIGGMIGKNRVFDADPLADVDRRVIEVRIELAEPEQAAKLINLQVNVDFQPRQ